jgi:hypothetical protein
MTSTTNWALKKLEPVKDQVLEKYTQKVAPLLIAEEFKVSLSTLYKALKLWQVPMRKKHGPHGPRKKKTEPAEPEPEAEISEL